MAALNTLTLPPAPPGPTDGANFGTRAFEFLNWWYATHGPELNAWVAAFNNATADLNSYVTDSGINASIAVTEANRSAQRASEASASASTASASATTASTKATEAAESAATAVNAAGNNIRGLDAEMAPSNALLGTAAYLDQTWLYASVPVSGTGIGQKYIVSLNVPGASIGDFVLVSFSSGICDIAFGQCGTDEYVYVTLANIASSLGDINATMYVAVMKRTPTR